MSLKLEETAFNGRGGRGGIEIGEGEVLLNWTWIVIKSGYTDIEDTCLA